MTIVRVFLRTRCSSINRQPTHGTTITAPSHTIDKSRPPIARRTSNATACRPCCACPACRLTSTAGSSDARAAGDSERTEPGTAEGASGVEAMTSSSFADARWTIGLTRQACQSGRRWLYCDLGTNLDEAFLI